jgi:hypothetical protein
MTLDGRQVETLHRALLSAFPTERALQQMVRFGMDLNLAEVASGNLADQVFDVLRYAEARGAVPQLIESALAANPTNPDLRALEPWLRAQQRLGLTTDGDRRGRRTLLDDATNEATERLRSIGMETLAPVLLEEQSYQVARPWDDEASAPLRRRPVTVANDILKVFDNPAISGRLLILGAPGSGKTTVLLQLMQHLIARVDPDQVSPIPVLFSLASWKSDDAIGRWVVEQLKVKYGVRVDLGTRWRDERRLTLLLDGLDEVAPEHQHACVQAINEFERAYLPPHLVVCSRLAEYENLTVKLHLRGAVCLRPFDADQIRAYLDRRGAPERWPTISSDEGLLEMAGSPLLLSLMSMLPSAPEAQRWQDAPTSADRRRRLFDTYLSSRVSTSANPGEYSGERTLQSLARLATMLQKQGQSEFLVERMQPMWLESAPQRWLYRAGVFIVAAAAVVLVLQSTMAIFDRVPPGNVALALRSQLRPMYAASVSQPLLFLVAVAVGAVMAARKTIVPIETVTWSWPRAARNMRVWAEKAAWTGLDYGFALGVILILILYFAGFEASSDRSLWQVAGEVTGAIGGVIGGIVLALARPSRWRTSLSSRAMPRRIEALAGAVLYGLVTAVTLFWLTGLSAGVSVFLMLGFSSAMNDRCRVLCLKAMIHGAIISLTMAAFSGYALSPSVPMFVWFSRWVGGGVAVGLIAGLTVGLAPRSRTSLRPAAPTSVAPGWTWLRTIAIGFAFGISLGAAVWVVVRAGEGGLIERFSVAVWFVHGRFVNTAGLAPVFALACGVGGAVIAGMLAGLTGALGGATGAPVERRLVPNQGIRQSGVNVAIFAALGTLVIGIPYGLFNLSISVVATRGLPSAGDWLHLAVAPGIMFGVLAGLVPGAACIQHFVLRFVLWASGVLPLRFVRFLNAATRRRVIQRVGGRYRFIHVLLRDHLAQLQDAVRVDSRRPSVVS